MNIWGLCGLAGSGKDTAADFLVKNNGFVKVAFADPLKRICKDVFEFSDEQLWGSSEKRNAPDERYLRTVTDEKGYQFSEPLTPRFALQQLGTEWGRNCYPNIWAEYAVRVAQQLLESTFEDCPKKGYHPLYYSAKDGLWQGHNVRQVQGVVISDVRFLNEIRIIKKAGGKVFRLLRGQGLDGAAGQHRSEQELQSIPLDEFDGIIDNREWPLEQLERRMTQLVEEYIGC
jgi:hypothetical protein